MKFLRSPLELVGEDETDPATPATGLRVVRNRIELGAAASASSLPVRKQEVIECGLVRGARSAIAAGRCPGVPFDERRVA